MRNTASAILAIAALALAGQSAMAMVGYNLVEVGANSDARLVVPFTPNAEEVAGETDFDVDATTGTGITVAGSPFAAGQFDGGAYYVQFISGGAEGLWSTITSNTAGELVLEDAGVLAEVTGTESFRVFRHLTINDVFNPDFAGILFSDVNAQSQVLIYENDLNNMIQNRGAIRSATFFNGSWVGSANGSTVVKPNTQVVFRNTSASPAQILTLGVAPDFDPSFLIAADGDVVIGTGLPVTVTLAESNVGGTNLRNALFFDPTAGVDSQSIGASTFFNGNWVGAITGSREISGSESFTLRLPAGEPLNRVTVPNPLK